MKKNVLVAVFMVLCGLLNAQTLQGNFHRTAQLTKATTLAEQDSIQDNEILSVTSNGSPCACSQLKCSKKDSNGNVCGGTMELKLNAFPVYSETEKCPSCNGKGCSLCNQTGKKYIRTDPGCKCKKCGNLIKQPNDC